jgi:hypothetical protein
MSFQLVDFTHVYVLSQDHVNHVHCSVKGVVEIRQGTSFRLLFILLNSDFPQFKNVLHCQKVEIEKKLHIVGVHSASNLKLHTFCL